MKKLLRVICITMCLALLFVGCSNGGGSLIKSKYDFDGTPYTLFTQQERRIWYYDVYNAGNGQIRYDSAPSDIIIVENGTVTLYYNSRSNATKTYGDIAEMTDDEIVDYCINECECGLTPINETDYNELREAYNEYNIGDEIPIDRYISFVLKSKEEIPDKLSNVAFCIKRDNTGNETVSEKVEFRKFSYTYHYEKGEITTREPLKFTIDSWITEPQIISSTKFAVLYCKGGSTSNYDTLLSTKINGEFRFNFDEPDTDFGIYKGSNS